MRNRLRRLYAHDRQFTWTARIGEVRADQGLSRCIRVRVWGAGKNSQVLQVDLLSTAPRSAWGDPAVVDGAYPASAHVRAVIDHALAYGWRPDEIGGTFVLAGPGHAGTLSLPGFVVTDLLLQAQRT